MAPDKDPADDWPQATEFAIEDYKGWLESMHRSEEIGEKRIEFFLTFATAALGAVLAVAKIGEGGTIDKAEAANLGRWVLPFLLIVGFLTFLRMLHRDSETDRCKAQLNRARAWFATQGAERHTGGSWPPWRPLKEHATSDRRVLNGGLTSMMITLNAVLFGLWLGVLNGHTVEVIPSGIWDPVIDPLWLGVGLVFGWLAGWWYKRCNQEKSVWWLLIRLKEKLSPR